MALEFETSVVYECRGEASARVYFVAAPTTDIDRETLSTFRITGHIIGPTCLYSSTLQARIPLTHRGITTWGGRSAVSAEAVVPDPCYWSSELPFLYRAVGTIAGAEQGGIAWDEKFGMRAVDVVKNKFALNGKIWVPRSVRRSVVLGDAPLSLWRETDTTMSADDPDENLLTEASRTGVYVIARIGVPELEAPGQLRKVAKYPAALIAGLNVLVNPDPALVRSVVLAVESCPMPNYLISGWDDEEPAKAYVLESSGVRNPYNIAEKVLSKSSPVLVQRNTGKRTLVDARKACDELQADLAEICDPAGYIV
jgi:hypothetical protein